MKIKTLVPLKDYPQPGVYDVEEENYVEGKGGAKTAHKGGLALVARGFAVEVDENGKKKNQSKPKAKRAAKKKKN